MSASSSTLGYIGKRSRHRGGSVLLYADALPPLYLIFCSSGSLNNYVAQKMEGERMIVAMISKKHGSGEGLQIGVSSWEDHSTPSSIVLMGFYLPCVEYVHKELIYFVFTSCSYLKHVVLCFIRGNITVVI